MLMAITTVLAALVALQWGYNPLLVVAVNGFFLVIDLVFVAANMTKLVEGGWFPLLLASVIAFLMLTWRTGWQVARAERAKLRQREDEFIEWVINTPPIRASGAAAIFTAATTGIPLCLTHHLRHNRVLHERVLLYRLRSGMRRGSIPSSGSSSVPVGAGITRVLFYFGFMETPDVMEGLQARLHASPSCAASIPRTITYYFRRVMVIPTRQGAGHVDLEKIAVRRDAPQRQSSGGLFRRTGRRRSWRSGSKSKSRGCKHRRAWLHQAGIQRRGPKARWVWV